MSDWTESRDDRLRKLWAEGKTSRQIGEALGVTRNAVLGRVHRLNLAARPSPIKHRAEYDKYRAPKKPERAKSRSAVNGGIKAAIAKASMPVAQQNGHTVVQPVSKRDGHAVGQLVAMPVVKPSPFKTCQWIDGEPRLRNFCAAETQPGSSYCSGHHERCWRKHQDVMKRAAE